MKITPKIKRNILIVISLLVVLAFFAALPAQSAFAGDNEPEYPAIPGLGRVPNPTLRLMLIRLRAWHTSQTTMFRDANRLAENFQSLITVQSGKGRDVTSLQTALDTFNAEITTAQTVSANAGKLLIANSGFNGSFNVIDRQAAGRTFLDTRAYLRDSHFRVRVAMDDLVRVYKHFRGTYMKDRENR
jgi:hypothetical protein